MAKLSSHKVRVYMGLYNLSPDITQVSVGLEVAALEVTTVTDSGDKFIAGLRQDTASFSALYDHAGAAGTGAAYALPAHIGGTVHVQVYIGTTTGNLAMAIPDGLVTQVGHPLSVAELVRTEFMVQPGGSSTSGGTIQRGRVLAVDLTAVTATGGNTDTFAASTGGATAYFTVHAMSAATAPATRA
jgi:hypothetical protein